jgi:hypothetical protein
MEVLNKAQFKVTMELRNNQWFGFGYGEVMEGTDMIVFRAQGQSSEQKPEFYDTYSYSDTFPVVDLI